MRDFSKSLKCGERMRAVDEEDRWRQQLRTFSQPPKEAGGGSQSARKNPGRLWAQSRQVMGEGTRENRKLKCRVLFLKLVSEPVGV